MQKKSICWFTHAVVSYGLKDNVSLIKISSILEVLYLNCLTVQNSNKISTDLGKLFHRKRQIEYQILASISSRK